MVLDKLHCYLVVNACHDCVQRGIAANQNHQVIGVSVSIAANNLQKVVEEARIQFEFCLLMVPCFPTTTISLQHEFTLDISSSAR